MEEIFQNSVFVSERLGHSILPPLYDASYSLISDINRAFRKSGFKISLEQFLILSGIQIGLGDSQNKLSAFLGRDKSVISRLLVMLEKNGYVVRESNGDDKRKKTIKITKKAIVDWKKMEDIAYNIIDSRCRNLDPEKLKTCMDILARFYLSCRPDQDFYKPVQNKQEK